MGERLPVPPQNMEIYCYLYTIETGLRELIVELLEAVAGPTWYKTNLPGDVLKKYREGLKSERSAKWVQTVPHHPIYYTDFPDLRKIIELSENWSKAFEPLFGRKDLIASTLSELEVIRNKIAHNRRATNSDLAITFSCFKKLSQGIGEERFKSLSERCTCALDIHERLTALREEGKRMLDRCLECKPIAALSVWPSVEKSWRFDESYLNESLGYISSYFRCLEEYSAIPRRRGSGYVIEAWVTSKDVANLYNAAEDEFRVLVA